MAEPWKLRDPEAPSELLLDAVVAGCASPAEAARVRAWCDAHPEAEAALAARRQGFGGLPTNPDRLRAAVARRLEAQPRGGWRARLASWAARLPSWVDWRVLAPTLLVAAAVAVFVARRDPPPPGVRGAVEVPGAVDPGAPDGPTVRAKGGLALRVFREREGAVDEVLPGDPVRGGDRLRFRPETPAPGFVLVVGVESDGTLFNYLPGAGDAALPVEAGPAADALPGAAQVDASVGREWVHLIFCPASFALADVRVVAPDHVDGPAGCRSTGQPVEKR